MQRLNRYCKLLIIVVVLLLTACLGFNSQSERITIKTDYIPSIELRVMKDTVRRLVLHALYEFTSGDSSYAAYVNQRNFSLVISNFETPYALPKSYPLNDSMFNVKEHGDIGSIAIDGDRMAFAQYRQFGVYNFKTHEMEFTKPMKGTDSLPIFHAYSDHHPLYYSYKRNEICILCSDFRQEGKDHSMDLGFHCQVDTKTGESKITPVNYPISFDDRTKGRSAFESVSYKGEDTILYNFSLEDYFLIYDKDKKTTRKVMAKSKYHETNEPFDTTYSRDYDKQVEHLIKSFVYSRVFYDKWRNCYYRIYQKKEKLRNKEGFFNTVYNKKKGVIVIDEDFNIIGEFEIPMISSYSSKVIKEGLVFSVPEDTIPDAKINYATIKPIL